MTVSPDAIATVDLVLPHHRYAIRIAPGLLAKLGDLLREVAPHQRCALLSDEVVGRHHGGAALRALRAAGYEPVSHTLPAGEDHKNLDAVRDAYETLVTHKLERRSPVIALGGGIVGDTAGFVAATYLRGVPFIQCPTTLLAMVDASVGGKVGINLPQGKNLVGAFHQPNLVIIDTHTLRTLPKRELRCGLAECVKHGVIRDAGLFDWIEHHVDDILGLRDDVLVELVRRNVQIKANVVMADEKETGERAHLNFGHTFAHAIEAACSFGANHVYHHGEAVALGMLAATRLAIDMGKCSEDLDGRLRTLLDRIGLPTRATGLPDPFALIEWMRVDKKVAGGRIRLVLPHRLGEVGVYNDADDIRIAAAWRSLG